MVRINEYPWRVAVTRDEDEHGPLSAALHAVGLTPVLCPVLVEASADPSALAHARANLHTYHWVVFASARGVRALCSHQTETPGVPAWPEHVRTAAVGAATARALMDAGVQPPPVTGDGDGATALWHTLSHISSWSGVRVLVVTTPGGRPELIEALRGAGAAVDMLYAYRMEPRPAAAIAADWEAAAPHALVVASPRVAQTLADAVGVTALTQLDAVAAIGHTTARALDALGIPSVTPDRADFNAVAQLIADVRTSLPSARPR